MGKSIGSTCYAIIKHRIYEVTLIEKKKVTVEYKTNSELKTGWLVKKPNNEEVFVYSEHLDNKLHRAKHRRNNMLKNKIKSKFKRIYKIFNSAKCLYFKLISLFYELQFIIIDCEFNNSNTEIIQIGLVKLTPNMEKVDSLNIFIKPIKPNVIHARKESRREILQKSNESEINFSDAIKTINDWIGNNNKTILCAWGGGDISTIRRNITLHNLSQNALNYNNFLDIQKIFTKERVNNYDYHPALEIILKKYKIEINKPMHNALHDAEYATSILENVYNRQPLLIAQHLA
jgi:hypothetical protein